MEKVIIVFRGAMNLGALRTHGQVLLHLAHLNDREVKEREVTGEGKTVGEKREMLAVLHKKRENCLKQQRRMMAHRRVGKPPAPP